MPALSVRLVVVEDHPMYRRGLCSMLSAVPGFEVVAETGDGTMALGLVEEHRPDIVMMDVQLPGQSGIAATRAISDLYPGSRVLILSLFQNIEAVTTCACHGAQLSERSGATFGE